MEKTALVTGASGNLGKAVVDKLVGLDFRVAVLDRRKGTIKAGGPGRTLAYEVDLTDQTAVEAVIEKVYGHFGSVGFAVLTVGGFAMGKIAETGLDEMDRMYRLNFVTAYNVARPLIQRMERQKGGQIVFIGTRPGLEPERGGNMIAYTLSKSILFSLARLINGGSKTHGVHASIVVPGTMDTPENRSSMPDADFSKWVSPDEVAWNIIHLASPAGSRLRESILKVYGEA
jgi:NAD(P)-dependent dehydrogenase (short-subunit alcohol dehydrogenase family)